MPPISPASGPVAVTGAAGFIGSWIVRDLVEAGYNVRACVRDRSAPSKVDHLLAFNSDASLRGRVELWEADLSKPGSYDAPFAGCAAVIHAGAAVGFNGESPQEVYDGCFVEVKHVLDSAIKGGAKRFVFTSSFAAVAHPRPPGYVFTERDWCGDNVAAYKGKWDDANIPKNRMIAYAKAKASCEKHCYEAAARHGGLEALSILPLHVVGPLLAKNHDQPFSWQNCIRAMLEGRNHPNSRQGGRMLWNCVDGARARVRGWREARHQSHTHRLRVITHLRVLLLVQRRD